MKNIVIIGGGTGTFTLLSGLRQYPSNNVVIVSSADDGGSTGRLRKELNVMPPGDLRQCLVGLSYTHKTLQDLFSYRFEQGSLTGHTVGNIILAALEKVTGSVEQAISEVAKLLNVRGEVIPITLFPTILTATLNNGQKIIGEHYIDEPRHNANIAIKTLSLTPSSPVNPRALKRLAAADAIIFGPGDLFTSTIPNLLVKGAAEAIKKSQAKKILITNLMTKYGQTTNFKASDFVKTLHQYLGKSLDVVIVNNQKPHTRQLKLYKKDKAVVVQADVEKIKKMGVEVVAESLLSKTVFQKKGGDVLKRSFLRHDAQKIAKLIWELI